MHISRKHKYLIILPLLLIALAVGSWLAGSAVDHMVVSRSENDAATLPSSGKSPQAESPSRETVQLPKNPAEADPLPLSVQAKLGLQGDEPQTTYYAFDLTPDDPLYPQWYTDIIAAPAAWDISSGSPDTIVAVIDSGFALSHEDLADAWWNNSAELGMTSFGDTCWSGVSEDKSTNNCDDDGNGYIDDWQGWDFSNDDTNPLAGENSVDGASHGTKVASLVGGRGNNAVGTASVNWQTQIMALQGLYDEGFGYSSDIASAIVYAVDMGADVINLSLGTPIPDTIIRSAIRYADANNVIVVAAAGNCGAEQESLECSGYPSPGGMAYPARYVETIAVGASTESDDRAGFSSWGPELNVVAPGAGSIQTPTWTTGNSFNAYSSSAYGTSFASPIVAGFVATIKGLQPTLSRSEILSIIETAADKVIAMGTQNRTDEYGYGRINVAAGLQQINVYLSQVNKATDRPASVTLPPQITTNIGHSSGSAVSNVKPATTYCVTSVLIDCTLYLRRSDGTSVSLGSKKTNSQGIVFWQWSTDDTAGAGAYEGWVSAGGLDSEHETLYVN